MEPLVNSKQHSSVVVSFVTTLVILLAIGTFMDYSISSILVNKNSIVGLIGANYGQIVAYIALTSGGLLLIQSHSRHTIIGSIAVLVSLFMNVADGFSYGLEGHQLLFAFLGVCITSFSSIALVRWLNTRNVNATRWGYFLVGSVTLQVLIITILKEVMTRPRMIALLDHQELFFQPWYQCNLADKQHWLSIVHTADYLKSFPSGHSGAAAMSFALATVIVANARNHNKYMYVGASIYTLAVMVSRIRIGAHFLTDTCVGAIIGIGCVAIIYHTVFNKSIEGEQDGY